MQAGQGVPQPLSLPMGYQGQSLSNDGPQRTPSWTHRALTGVLRSQVGLVGPNSMGAGTLAINNITCSLHHATHCFPGVP